MIVSDSDRISREELEALIREIVMDAMQKIRSRDVQELLEAINRIFEIFVKYMVRVEDELKYHRIVVENL
ncbi:MAG: hypothetical protein ABWW65_00935 [Thermoprotei archaeon]